MGTNGNEVPGFAGQLENGNEETLIAVRDLLQATPSTKGKLLDEIRATTKVKTPQEIKIKRDRDALLDSNGGLW